MTHSRTRLRGRLGLVALVVTAQALALTAGLAAFAQDGPPAPERLPDLDEQVPSRLSVHAVRREGRIRWRLGFRSAAVNVGPGPLFIRGRRTPGDRTLVTEQVVVRADGTTARYPNVGRLRYERFPDHQHWHLLGFAQYELRRPSGRLARPDLKQGFCLTDGFPARGIPDPPPRILQVGHDDTDCDRQRPRTRYLEEGISVGWGDDYDPHLEGQQIDITGLRPGQYDFVHIANVSRRLRERSYRNNTASVRLRISWPGEFRSEPRVEVVRRCPGRPRCHPR